MQYHFFLKIETMLQVVPTFSEIWVWTKLFHLCDVTRWKNIQRDSQNKNNVRYNSEFTHGCVEYQIKENVTNP